MSNTPPATTDTSNASSFLSELRSSDRSDGLAPIPARRKRVPLHLVVAGLVIAVGGASLMGMRQIGMRAGMTFETDASLLPVDSPDSTEGQRLRAVMAELELSQRGAGASPAKPDKNPFSLAAGGPAKADDSDAEDRELAARQAEEALRRQAEIESAAAELQLVGIVGGRGSYVAAIGNKNYRVGDVVGGMFTLTEIDGRTVTVAVDDQLYELTLGQKPVKSSRKLKKTGRAAR